MAVCRSGTDRKRAMVSIRRSQLMAWLAVSSVLRFTAVVFLYYLTQIRALFGSVSVGTLRRIHGPDVSGRVTSDATLQETAKFLDKDSWAALARGFEEGTLERKISEVR
jgi:hypothetical protein